MPNQLPTLKEFKNINSLPFYTKILVNDIYEEVLKENGFDEYGQPRRSCKDPDISVEKLERLAYKKYLSDFNRNESNLDDLFD